VTIRSSYKDIKVDQVEGELEIDGSSCSVTGTDIKGNTTILSSYKPIKLERIEGAVSVRTSSADIAITDAKESVKILSKYKPILLTRIGGDVQIDGDSCAVVVDTVKGAVDITNSYKHIILKHTASSINARGNSSPIEVTNIDHLPADSTVRLITTYKSIILHLPSSAPVSITAHTTYGKIDSDYPVLLDPSNPKLAPGKTTVFVKTSRNITIKKD
jgi:hypothetical protein